MENVIKLQSEFEELVENLERLKSVVILTEENTENSKVVIEAADILLTSLNTFIFELRTNLNSSMAKLTQSEVELSEVLVRMESRHKGYLADYQSILSDSNLEITRKADTITQALESEINELKMETGNLKVSMESILLQNLKSLESNLNENSGNIKSLLKENDFNKKLILKLLGRQRGNFLLLTLLLIIIATFSIIQYLPVLYDVLGLNY